MAYHSKGAKFPYDPEEVLINDSGEDLDFVKYYKFNGADICKTTLATAQAMGRVIEMKKKGLTAEPAELRNRGHQNGDIKPKERLQRKSVTAMALDSQQIEAAASAAAKEPNQDKWIQARVTLKNYLNGPAHRSLMLILTIVSSCWHLILFDLVF